MKKRILSVLAALVLVIALMVPISTPVLAAAPILSDITPHYSTGLPYFITDLGINRTYTGLHFLGSDLTGASAITFSGSGVTASITNVTDTDVTANVTVAAGAAHGPRSVTITATSGTSASLYNKFFVGEFSTPADTNASDTYVALAPYYDAAGGSNITTPGTTMITTSIAEGTTVWYKMTLKRVDVAYSNTMGGQLSILLPGDAVYTPVAGYGAATPAMPQIGEIVVGGDIVLWSPLAYTASFDDLDLTGHLYAEACWGIAGGNTTQISGFIEGYSPSPANSSQTNTLEMKGSLKVTKEVVIPSGVSLTGIDATFSVGVTGPASYSQTLYFTVEDGVITSPASGYHQLDNLTPGNYYITETPGSAWSAVVTSSPTVVASGEVSECTVTNTFIPGNLEVTKLLDLNGAGPSGINRSFTVTVTGPTYPSGISHVFNCVDGVIVSSAGYENPWVLDNITPGSYTVLETTPGTPWSATGGGGVTVNPNSTAYSEITNTYIPGSLEVTKLLDLNGLVGTGIDDTFTVTVTGPSYPSGISHVFNCVDGVIINSVDHENPWVLNYLIPGSYTVVESDPGGYWSVTYYHGSVTVNSGAQAVSRVTNEYGEPHTTLQTISVNPTQIPREGDFVTVTVTDLNDGELPISGAYFEISGVPAFSGSPAIMGYVAGDTNTNNLMDPGEIWTFSYTTFISESTRFTAVGHGMAGGTDVTGISETGTVLVHSPPDVPATSSLGIGMLILGLGGAAAFFSLKRRKQTRQ